MKSFKKLFTIVLLVLILGCTALSLSACKKDEYIDGFYYRIKSDSTIAVYVEKYSMDTLVIPETILGLKVTGVMKPKQQGISTSLTKVVLPKTVRWIEKESFKDCVALEEINFPENLDVIYEQAFMNCNSLTTAILPNKLTGIYEEAFCNCSSLKIACIPKSVGTMYYNVFTNAPELEIWVERDKAPWHWGSWYNGVKEVHWNWDGVLPEE